LYSFQAKVCELKAAIEEQKQNEEKLAIKMSQKIQKREQELEEIKREIRFSLTPTAHDELREVEKGVVRTDRPGTDAASKPTASVRNGDIHYDPAINNFIVSQTMAAALAASSHYSYRAYGHLKIHPVHRL
jgi:hypothetical protein